VKFVNYVTYTTDKAKIAEHRPRHREYLNTLLKEGKLVTAGPFADDSGALFVYETDSAEEAAAIVAADPFSASGVFQSSDLKPWKLVFSNVGLLRTSG
jgi:uncharacterized protein YciI